MEPGTIYKCTIKLYPTSNIIKKGHRIRVDISSSNFPRFDVNPNAASRSTLTISWSSQPTRWFMTRRILPISCCR